MSFVQVRIEEELKEEAIKLFNELGLDLSTAIRLFLKKCVEDKKLPFKLKVREHDNLKMFYYRGLKEWPVEKGYLIDICKSAQDYFKKYLDYFRIKYDK